MKNKTVSNRESLIKHCSKRKDDVKNLYNVLSPTKNNNNNVRNVSNGFNVNTTKINNSSKNKPNVASTLNKSEKE